MKISKNSWLILAATLATSLVHAASQPSFGADWDSSIYMFDLSTPSVPATIIIVSTISLWPDCLAISPDGKTVYVTYNKGPGDVYSFPSAGPYNPIALGTGVDQPIGIAISSDGQTGFICRDTNVESTTSGIWSFPLAGSNHTATQLTADGTVINTPTLIVISGSTAYVGEYTFNGHIYSFPVNATSYNATAIQSGVSVNGLAVSSDGYLYFSSNVTSDVRRVPLASPTDTPTIVATGFSEKLDGLAVSADGKTVYVASSSGSSTNGIYSFPTDQGFPQTPTFLSGLDFPEGLIALVIQQNFLLPPSNLTGSQLTNDFGLNFEIYNNLQWEASLSNVAGYFVYRDGTRIATLDASTHSYQDHNRRKKITYSYSVTGFDASGNESTPISIQIN